ncbi:MAG TPA: hypothetical protein VGJ63_07040 [Micromonosporaceae bacterium]|jgi:hypothetical protein
MLDPMAVSALLGRNLERLRVDATATYNDLARAARRLGLDWSEQWFAAIELGTRPMSAEELIALPMVLAEALRRTVGLGDLLLGDEPIRLAAGSTPVSAGALRNMLAAPPQRRAFVADHETWATPDDSPLVRAAERMREIREAGLGDVDVRALAQAEEGGGEREARLARRLGVPPVVVFAACAALWGRSLTEERAARVREGGDSAPPAVIMRRLTAELARKIARAAAAGHPDEAAAPVLTATIPPTSALATQVPSVPAAISDPAAP